VTKSSDISRINDVTALADPMAVLDAEADSVLTDDEARYVQAARAANTIRGYRSDWAEFTSWCAQTGHDAFPATSAAVAGYLTALAGHGAAVGTMSRRLSSIRFAHRLRDLPDPTENARVVAVWEGIRRTHGAPPVQATPLMPPELFDVLAACPTTKRWAAGSKRASETDLAGARDRVLLLVGFVAAMRRSELSALTLQNIGDHENGLVLTLPRSKTNQYGDAVELVVLPRSGNPDRCPVAAVKTWMQLAGIAEGPLLRPVSKGNRALPRPLTAAAVNDLVKAAVARAGLNSDVYSAHSLRAGFVTYAHLRGATDRAIAHQTRHRSLATLGTYVRVANVWTDNAATQLGL
jgi:site-specific recombinase XerD